MNIRIEDVAESEVAYFDQVNTKDHYTIGLDALKKGKLAIVNLAGGVGSRWTKGAGAVKSLNHYSKLSGKHRSFIETHLAKNRKLATTIGRKIPHVFTTSYLTHNAIHEFLDYKNGFGMNESF